MWKQKWSSLRDIQEATVAPVLEGGHDVLISAGTASGKTEAAFLPIASSLVDSDEAGVQALYVGPLKALINDQFERLDGLCEDLGIPVHRWHGDVSASEKQAMRKDPRGILLITPESLEAMFVLRGPQIPRVFAALRHVVVDELHAYLGTERGRQLQSLLHRLEFALGRRVQRIGLSATLGDLALAAEALRPRQGADVLVVRSAKGEQELRLQVRGYREAEPKAEPREDDALHRADEPVTQRIVVPEGLHAACEHMFKVLRGSNHLVFANARNTVERVTDRLTQICERENVPNEFFAHHGSLSKEQREFTEERLKRGDRPATGVCSATLELGIDIGRVTSVALVGAPHTVSSLRQRMGRSGRRGGPAILRVYVIEPEVTDRTPPQDRLRPHLLQAVSTVRLMLDGWCEPPVPSAYHLSTLVQQTLSAIRQYGGATARDLWNLLARTGAFPQVDANLFADFLRDLRQHEVITQMEDGTITLGEGGEVLTDHYSFYTAFQTPEEWTLMTEGHVLGTIPIDQPIFVGLFLVFAGRRWRVSAVNEERRDVFVVPAPGGMAPRFSGTGGDVHDRVRQEMLALLRSTEVPAYLDERARDLLDEARVHFARLGLAERSIVEFGNETLWFPWIGDRVMNTLVVHLHALGVGAGRDGIAISVRDVSAADLRRLLKAASARGPADSLALAASVSNKVLEKHDVFLRPELLDLDYAAKRLDVRGAHAAATSAVIG